MRYWWVNQNQTYKHEIAGGYLWSPKTNANGARNQFYENMQEVRRGDVILSYKGTLIGAVGVATGSAQTSERPSEFSTIQVPWSAEGWFVPVSYREIQNPIRPADHMELIKPTLPIKYSPLRENGHGLQSVYLAAVPDEMAVVLINLLNGQVESLTSEITSVRSGSRKDWVFQSNPKRYSVIERALESKNDSWAMNSRRDEVQIGDRIYFYQSGKNAGIYVTGTVKSLPEDRGDSSEFGRWGLQIEYDDLLTPPLSRDGLLSDSVLQQERIFVGWQGTNWLLSDTASNRLAEIVLSSTSLPVDEPEIHHGESLTDEEISELSTGEPDRVLRAIKQRRGQKTFRDKLLLAYDGLCAVTGDGPRDVLEAAHISPYSESGLNHPANGLLLRADIHTLFDLNLIKINPDSLTLEISANLYGTSYSKLEGVKLRQRKDGVILSSPLLKARYED